MIHSAFEWPDNPENGPFAYGNLDFHLIHGFFDPLMVNILDTVNACCWQLVKLWLQRYELQIIGQLFVISVFAFVGAEV